MHPSELLAYAREKLGDTGIGGGVVTVGLAALKIYGEVLKSRNTRALAKAYELSRERPSVIEDGPVPPPEDAGNERHVAYLRERATLLQARVLAEREALREATRSHDVETAALRARIREIEGELAWATSELAAKTHALDRCRQREEALAGEIKADLRARSAGASTPASTPPGARTVPPLPRARPPDTDDEKTPRPRGLPPLRKRG